MEINQIAEIILPYLPKFKEEILETPPTYKVNEIQIQLNKLKNSKYDLIHIFYYSMDIVMQSKNL